MRKFLFAITYFFTPNCWRIILFNQVKIRVYLRGGTHVDFWCRKWNTRADNGKINKWIVEGNRNTVWFEPGEIVAWKEV